MSISVPPPPPPPVANAPKPPVVLPGSGNNIIVNPLQRGNLVLDCIKNVGKEFGDIVTDYQVGRTTGVLFLSLKYHRLHPEYIYGRIEKLGSHAYNLRILLILCDVSEHRDPIRELTKACLINNITVIVAFSFEDAGHYLATFKQFEHKPPDWIKERVDNDYASIFRSALTSISKVNKTDVETLRTSLGSFANIAKASSDQLQNLPGFGQAKVKNLKAAFEKPFRNNATDSLSSSASQFKNSVGDDEMAGSSKRNEQRKQQDLERLRQVTANRPPREPSPVWDIELDLNDSSPPVATAETGPLPESFSRLPVEETGHPVSRSSPVWDIELDLNGSGDES